MRILDSDPAGLDSLDSPGMGAEQKYVARETLDGEIFVDGADGFVVGLGDYGVVRVFRNSAAGGDGGEARAPAAFDAMVHLIAMKERPAAAARRHDAVGK